MDLKQAIRRRKEIDEAIAGLQAESAELVNFEVYKMTHATGGLTIDVRNGWLTARVGVDTLSIKLRSIGSTDLRTFADMLTAYADIVDAETIQAAANEQAKVVA